jgi:hypothetical protein
MIAALRFCLVVVGLLLLPKVAFAQIPVGEYLLDESLSDDINVAINTATADMNFIARPIARKRLRSTNPPTRIVTIEEFGDTVQVTSDHQISVRSKPDGVPMKWSAFKGELLDVTTVIENGILCNTFSAGDGARINRYTLREDGMLEMSVTVSSPRLRRPLEYKRVYRRVTASQ